MIEACELSPDEARAQADRYRELSRRVAVLERRPALLSVRFSGDLDRNLLEETIAVERECCSFFGIDFDAEALTLSISVEEERLVPALDPLEAALGSRNGDR